MDARRLARGVYRPGNSVRCGHVSGPLVRLDMAAGPDEVRGPTPDQGIALCGAWNWTGLVDPGANRFAIRSRSPSQNLEPSGSGGRGRHLVSERPLFNENGPDDTGRF